MNFRGMNGINFRFSLLSSPLSFDPNNRLRFVLSLVHLVSSTSTVTVRGQARRENLILEQLCRTPFHELDLQSAQ
jgi:hypothetical protein